MLTRTMIEDVCGWKVGIFGIGGLLFVLRYRR